MTKAELERKCLSFIDRKRYEVEADEFSENETEITCTLIVRHKNGGFITSYPFRLRKQSELSFTSQIDSQMTRVVGQMNHQKH